MEKDRVLSFSYKPSDKKSIANIKIIRDYCRLKGITFSFLMLKAIDDLTKQLTIQKIKVDNDTNRKE